MNRGGGGQRPLGDKRARILPPPPPPPPPELEPFYYRGPDYHSLDVFLGIVLILLACAIIAIMVVLEVTQ